MATEYIELISYMELSIYALFLSKKIFAKCVNLNKNLYDLIFECFNKN